jgi:hypothetical protein
MVLQAAVRKVWKVAQRFLGPVLRARWLPLAVVAVFALVSCLDAFSNHLGSLDVITRI